MRLFSLDTVPLYCEWVETRSVFVVCTTYPTYVTFLALNMMKTSETQVEE